jgi:hypothetical protein
MRLLQACERLKIPNQLWPKIPFPVLPRQQIHLYRTNGPLHLPNFFPLYETEAQWKAKVQLFVDDFVRRETNAFSWRLRAEVRQRHLKPIKQTRDTTPLNVRYEWAAKRICLKQSFPEIAAKSKPLASVDAIKKAVYQIMRETGLKRK